MAESHTKNKILPKLHIIEPTLFDQTGHGYSYTSTLIQANDIFDLHCWIDQRGHKLFQSLPCHTHAFFSRKFRQWQKFFLYYKLLQQRDPIFIPTATLLDLVILDFWLPQQHAGHNIYLHFHQFKKKPKKIKKLRSLFSKRPNITILTPTEALSQHFIAQGAQQCHIIPCPTFAPATTHMQLDTTFKKVLYAGAARADKGFPALIDTLSFLRTQQNWTPFEIQISTPNSQRYDEKTTVALKKLRALPNDHLTLHHNTLVQKQYQALFPNSIVLLLYDQKEYQDKFSGVALDCFYAGSPILTTPGTWIASQVQRFQAGIVLNSLFPQHIMQSIEQIKQQYYFFQQNALMAGKILAKEHDPKNTLKTIQLTLSRY